MRQQKNKTNRKKTGRRLHQGKKRGNPSIKDANAAQFICPGISPVVFLSEPWVATSRILLKNLLNLCTSF
jgi:hypothetical protein